MKHTMLLLLLCAVFGGCAHGIYKPRFAGGKLVIPPVYTTLSDSATTYTYSMETNPALFVPAFQLHSAAKQVAAGSAADYVIHVSSPGYVSNLEGWAPMYATSDDDAVMFPFHYPGTPSFPPLQHITLLDGYFIPITYQLPLQAVIKDKAGRTVQTIIMADSADVQTITCSRQFLRGYGADTPFVSSDAAANYSLHRWPDMREKARSLGWYRLVSRLDSTMQYAYSKQRLVRQRVIYYKFRKQHRRHKELMAIIKREKKTIRKFNKARYNPDQLLIEMDSIAHSYERFLAGRNPSGEELMIANFNEAVCTLLTGNTEKAYRLYNVYRSLPNQITFMGVSLGDFYANMFISLANKYALITKLHEQGNTTVIDARKFYQKPR